MVCQKQNPGWQAGASRNQLGRCLHYFPTASEHQTQMLKAAEGDLEMVSKILAAQAITLDGMFAELARRAALNMGEYISAAERYGRLALKAQSNCRATLDTLAKLHQPREQTVRHVHVNEGGQAIVANQFHNHSGGQSAISGNEMQMPELRTFSETEPVENPQ